MPHRLDSGEFHLSDLDLSKYFSSDQAPSMDGINITQSVTTPTTPGKKTQVAYLFMVSSLSFKAIVGILTELSHSMTSIFFQISAFFIQFSNIGFCAVFTFLAVFPIY